jgi:hypothetical protein
MLHLTPEIVEKIKGAIRIGCPVQTAAALQGISYGQLREWILKGKEDSTSIYGQFIENLERSIAEWETKDLMVIEKHAMGAPAEYAMEVVRDRDGSIIYQDNGKPLMQVSRNADGNAIMLKAEIRSDWKAAMERLARRKPKYWAPKDHIDVDGVLRIENQKVESREALTFEQKVSEVMDKLQKDV